MVTRSSTRPSEAVKKTKPPPERRRPNVDRAALLAMWGELYAAAELFEAATDTLLDATDKNDHPDREWLDHSQIKEANYAAGILLERLGSTPILTHERAGCLLLPRPQAAAGGTQ